MINSVRVPLALCGIWQGPTRRFVVVLHSNVSTDTWNALVGWLCGIYTKESNMEYKHVEVFTIEQQRIWIVWLCKVAADNCFNMPLDSRSSSIYGRRDDCPQQVDFSFTKNLRMSNKEKTWKQGSRISSKNKGGKSTNEVILIMKVGSYIPHVYDEHLHLYGWFLV